MLVVEVLDGLFEADCNEQADDDSSEVDEEVFPGVDGFTGSVDVKHGWCVFLTGWWRV
jgi:hypothetical protein